MPAFSTDRHRLLLYCTWKRFLLKKAFFFYICLSTVIYFSGFHTHLSVLTIYYSGPKRQGAIRNNSFPHEWTEYVPDFQMFGWTNSFVSSSLFILVKPNRKWAHQKKKTKKDSDNSNSQEEQQDELWITLYNLRSVQQCPLCALGAAFFSRKRILFFQFTGSGLPGLNIHCKWTYKVPQIDKRACIYLEDFSVTPQMSFVKCVPCGSILCCYYLENV